jgi:hypothetical protein
MAPIRNRIPTAFTLPELGEVHHDQLSAMMPSSPAFDEVYATIIRSAQRAGVRCSRVDGIWENHSVIQDVISLIDRSRYVDCDCSGRNPSIFYEIGIGAHVRKRDDLNNPKLRRRSLRPETFAVYPLREQSRWSSTARRCPSGEHSSTASWSIGRRAWKDLVA